jgi:hypothetical protein
MRRQDIDKMFYRVLGADIACHCDQHCRQNDEVTEKAPQHVASQKADRRFERIAWHGHDGVLLTCRCTQLAGLSGCRT